MADILDNEWEDGEVIDYIIQYLDKDDRKKVTREQIEEVLDIIVDYYDEKGLVEDDEDNDEEVVEEAEIDEEEMFEFVKARVNAEKGLENIDDDLLQQIIDGEYHYGVSIGIYSEGDEDEDDEEYGTYED